MSSTNSEEISNIRLLNSICTEANNVLVELRDAGQLCDAVIKVNGESLQVHRAILSACSPYFRALFTNENFDNSRTEVNITDISIDIMRHIIEYAYTQACNITSQNARELLMAADYFQVNGLQKDCSACILSELSAHNCIGIEKFARWYICTSLAREAYKYLLHNFSDVYKMSDEFLQLGIEEICDVIKSDELNLKSEEIAFDAIIRWINHEPEKRKHNIIKLIKNVRFGQLSTQYFIDTVKNHEYIRYNEECQSFIIETLNLLFELDLIEHQGEHRNPMSTPRLPYEILFAINGWNNGSPTNTVEAYDPRADRWFMCRSVKSDYRAYHGTCLLDGLVYVIGGFDGIDYFNSVRCFDPINQTWSEAAPMHSKRCYVSVAVLGRHIYAMGGSDGQLRQNSVEKYNKFRNQWSLTKSMNRHRSDASAASLKERIYICGGFDGQNILSCAEYYSDSVGQWTMVAAMENIRSGFRLVAYGDFIYALGGFDGNNRLSEVERYNPSCNAWRPMPSMGKARSNFASEILEEMIYVIGGFDGMTTIENVECYDTVTQHWYDTTDMTIDRSALSACVVKGLPNVKKYIHRRYK